MVELIFLGFSKRKYYFHLKELNCISSAGTLRTKALYFSKLKTKNTATRRHITERKTRQEGADGKRHAVEIILKLLKVSLWLSITVCHITVFRTHCVPKSSLFSHHHRPEGRIEYCYILIF